MSRFNPSRNVEPVLAAAEDWIHRSLVQQRSIFTGDPLWTPGNVDALRVAFTENPDSSAANFWEKLQQQTSAAPAPAVRLMAEMLWALFLFQSNTLPKTKRAAVQEVWEWSSDVLSEGEPLLSDEVLTGIGNPGAAFNTQRWRELYYLIGLAADLGGKSLNERQAIFADRNKFEAWIQHAPQDGDRQFRQILRYLAFPDQNERITARNDRRKILNVVAGAERSALEAMSDAELDDALGELRARLQAETGVKEVDFYEDDLVARWRAGKPAGSTVGAPAPTPYEAGYAALRQQFLVQFPGFTSFQTDARYAGERGYKDELRHIFATEVRPLLAARDWRRAGTAAIAMLKRPLPGNKNAPQNFVGWRYGSLVSVLDEARSERFGQAIGELIDDATPLDARIERFTQDLKSIVGEGVRVIPAAQRSIAGMYLALADPGQHVFLKTQELQRALRQLDPGFRWTSSGLTGGDVAKVEELAEWLFVRLGEEEWDPLDYMDVQGFLWVATAYDQPESDAKPEIEAIEDQAMGTADAHNEPLNQILFGPPGTGKTFHTIDRAMAILDPKVLAANPGSVGRRAVKERFDELVAANRIRFVTFHQSFSYEDFVEGIGAESSDANALQYRVKAGVFRQICEDASTHQKDELPYVLIIDEINRGNVSRIFGELITLIEPSKRSGRRLAHSEQLHAVLPYSRTQFSVPSNVYLIGTMNTADRSLAGLDIALRRRFEFVEMPPRADLLEGREVAGIDLGEMLAAINHRIEVLLDRDHQIGHAYFMSLTSESGLDALARVFRNQILPLLQEYFFEDWQRIQWVLNDHRKRDEHSFVVEAAHDMARLFGNTVDVPTESRLWRVNKGAFERRESYAGIIGVDQD